MTCTATFTVTAPDPLTITCPTDLTVDACLTQAAIDQAYADWLGAATTTGGCNVEITSDAPAGAPLACTGGEVVVTFTATDTDADGVVCQTQTCTATFTVTAPDPLTITCPTDLNAQQVSYTITPLVYGLCELEPISSTAWVNPTPDITLDPTEIMICEGETVTLRITNPHTLVMGQWVYDLEVRAEEGIGGSSTGTTGSTATEITETLTNDATGNRNVEYHFTPRIIVESEGRVCTGPEETATVIVRPKLSVYYDIEVSDYNGYNVSCYGYSDGWINLVLKGNPPPFTYEWTGPAGFTAATKDVAGLVAGTYTVVITDIMGCTITEEIELIEPGELGMNLTPSISLDGAYNINCYGDSTGWIDIEVYNYVNTVNYLWSDMSRQGDRESLPAGNYEVLIVDANNCRARSEITLTQPDPINIEFEHTNPFCPGSPDGEIRLTATGGIPGYMYQWSNGGTTNTISDITAGIYSVAVTDMNLCSVIDSTDLISQWDHCLQIPNAISPNGDGLNEVWNLGFTEMYPMMEVRIFNNWGQLIWESARGYTHPWDGTSNGRPLPVDSYFYIINLNDGTDPVTGHVNIIK